MNEHLRVMKEKVKQLQSKRCRHLKNLQMTKVQFWTPMQDLKDMEMVELGKMKTSNFLEYVLVSQILERKEECCTYMKQALELPVMMKMEENCSWLTDDMPEMVKEWHAAMKKHALIAVAAN